jgi:hypothetical protein
MRRSGRSGDGQTGCIVSSCRRVETRTRLYGASVLPAPPERREDSGDAAPLVVGKPRKRYHATRVTSEPSFGRERPDRTPGKMDKPLRLPDLEPGRDQKSPLRRCFELRHPLRAGPPVRLRLLVRSLGVEQLLEPSTTGVFPASCPEIHRPARNHRHVRIWAGRCIGTFARGCKSVCPPPVQNSARLAA